eukprot:CAMPEP_0181130392 /NCGR_PEP_ID=MMETSP1071-20121207/29838_1 /TAXON_ID=35127 /ORGANISM="Thalassiosira sp., Strain NH16" /LENGTH=602 /DNA_ID=CAMNT_0023216457 /DNA_START=179 /DNA_END=1987 /DNA_ORIENTATION=-
MGNTLAYESQGPSSGDGDEKPIVTRNGPQLTLQRKSSSFLEEPITHKLTERGETDVKLGNENGGGRDGIECGSDSMIRYAVSEMQGWRSHMEDKHALNPTLAANRQQKRLLEDHHLFAVFDGHGGDFASHYCGEHLVETLTSRPEWKEYLKLIGDGSRRISRATSKQRSVSGLRLLKSALHETFLELDEKLMAAQRSRRLAQLSQLESLVYSMGGTVEHDVFHKGTADHEKIINFDRQLPTGMPTIVPMERSGSTGVVVLVTPHHIICANAGDSRAILSKRNEVLPLSFDHKPTNDVELTRVEKDGGFVRAGRVDGDLAVSRSFGDFGYKNRGDRDYDSLASSTRSSFQMDPSGLSISGRSDMTTSNSKDHRVSVHPDILVHTREPSRDEFIVLACDGIWDRLTNKMCGDLVRSLIRDNDETDVGLMCEEVIDTALELDSRDNMTCLLAVFPGAGMGSGPPSGASHASSTKRGVMGRRMYRERSWGDDSTPAKRALERLEARRRKHREVLAAAGQSSNKTTKMSQVPLSRSQGSHGRRRSSSRGRGPHATAEASRASSASMSASASMLNKRNKARSKTPPRRSRSSKNMRIQVQGATAAARQ